MAQIDTRAHSGIEWLSLRKRVSLPVATILGVSRTEARKAANRGVDRTDTAAKGKRLADPVGRDAGYLRDLDIEIGF